MKERLYTGQPRSTSKINVVKMSKLTLGEEVNSLGVGMKKKKRRKEIEKEKENRIRLKPN
jgi:hypothetical protein